MVDHLKRCSRVLVVALLAVEAEWESIQNEIIESKINKEIFLILIDVGSFCD